MTCNAAGIPPLARATRIQSAIDGFTCHALGPVEDQSYGPRVGAHLSVPRMLLGLWVAIGALVASAPGVQAEESLSHRCTMDRCTMEHHDATGVTTPRQR